MCPKKPPNKTISLFSVPFHFFSFPSIPTKRIAMQRAETQVVQFKDRPLPRCVRSATEQQTPSRTTDYRTAGEEAPTMPPTTLDTILDRCISDTRYLSLS